MSFPVVDLSHPLDARHISIYPGDPEFKCCPHTTIDRDGYSVQSISMGSHTGTHIDAPAHFIVGGKTIDQIPLSSLTGPALVIDLIHKGEREIITWDDLVGYSERMKPGVILLLRTGWSRYWATPKYVNHPFLTRDAAKQIVTRGVSVLGIDTFSPDETEGSGDFGVHEVFSAAGNVIVENLTNLELIGPDFIVSLAPLNLQGGDGAPARACAFPRI